MNRYLALLTLSFLAVNIQAAETGVHLFLLSGQSNMARLDPKRVFTPGVEKHFGAENVVVVKNAKGGQPIRRWDKSWVPTDGQDPDQIGDLYAALLQDTKTALTGKNLKSVTFIWMQGERDSKEALSELYTDSFGRVLEQLRTDLEWSEINFIIGRLSDSGLGKTEWEKMRNIQMALAESSPRGAWVNTDDLNDGIKRKDGKVVDNDLHYSVEGYDLLAQRYVESAIKLIEEHP